MKRGRVQKAIRDLVASGPKTVGEMLPVLELVIPAELAVKKQYRQNEVVSQRLGRPNAVPLGYTLADRVLAGRKTIVLRAITTLVRRGKVKASGRGLDKLVWMEMEGL